MYVALEDDTSQIGVVFWPSSTRNDLPFRSIITITIHSSSVLIKNALSTENHQRSDDGHNVQKDVGLFLIRVQACTVYIVRMNE